MTCWLAGEQSYTATAINSGETLDMRCRQHQPRRLQRMTNADERTSTTPRLLQGMSAPRSRSAFTARADRTSVSFRAHGQSAFSGRPAVCAPTPGYTETDAASRRRCAHRTGSGSGIFVIISERRPFQGLQIPNYSLRLWQRLGSVGKLSDNVR